MAITSTRQIIITQTSPLLSNWTFAAAANTNAPGDARVYTLASGTNTITFPSGGTLVVGATIIPPTGNTASITLKGTTGDTGIAIHPIDPTSLAFDTTQSTFVLVVASTVTGLRIIWT